MRVREGENVKDMIVYIKRNKWSVVIKDKRGRCAYCNLH